MTDPQPPARYKVGLVQMAMSADPDANLKKAVAKVSEAAAAGARLVCLPELFRSQYFAQHEDPALFDLAEPVPGPSTEALGKVAKQAGVVVIVPVFERRAAGLYHNSAAVIDADGRVLGIYRKMHIPDDPAYYEKFYFTPGDLGFRAFDTRVGRIGTLVCWDQWYPEGAEAQVPGREVELLVVGRIVGDVHLAVDPQHAPVGVDNGGAVVVEAGGTALEHGHDYHDARLLRHPSHRLRGRPRNRAGQVAQR